MTDRRDRVGGSRRARGEDAPRPGGRAAAHNDQRGGTPRFATQGSAALQAAPAGEPARAPQRGPWLRVAPPLPVSVPRAPFVLLLLLVVVGGVLGILLVNTKINENAFEIKNLQRQQAALDTEEQDLRRQIADFESPGNLAARARELGLVPAEAPAFIRLPDGRVIGVPQPAGGTSTGARNTGR